MGGLCGCKNVLYLQAFASRSVSPEGVTKTVRTGAAWGESSYSAGPIMACEPEV